MASSLVLRGPPEIYCLSADTAATPTPELLPETEMEADSNPKPRLDPEDDSNEKPTLDSEGESYSSEDPFMDYMVSDFNKASFYHSPLRGFTENSSATFLTSGNPCLDFFFHVVPDTPSDSIKTRLDSSWNHDPLTTLKLICNLRGVRGTGKSDKEGFYTSSLWLHANHPKTLAYNLPSIADFGYFKDFPEIIFRLLDCVKSPKRMPAYAGGKIEQEEKSRKEKKISMATKAVQKFADDPNFRLLYESVADLFAEHLIADVKFLKEGEASKISLAAKWCPSLDSCYDRSSLLCESIARKMFSRDSHPEYEGIEDGHYAYRVRDRLRKEVLVPLRKTLDLPEVYMSANQWQSIPYTRVASVAMKTYSKHFQKHDQERFMEYLQQVKTGKAKIASGALLPHEIIASLDVVEGNEVAELQWRRMVDDMKKKGKLNNCLAICDVSGSMNGIFMEVSVALGILVSELSEEPWKGKVITFSERPQLHMIQGDSLLEKTQFVKEMNWGANTDFQRVFDRILKVAMERKLRADQMIKRLFVFSDMEFDQASANDWETDYEVIARKFGKKGYESAVPEIVFWNLRDSRSTPVAGTQKGVALVSGFSKNLLTLFLDGGGVVDPVSVMEAAISGDEYKMLAVFD